MTSLVSVRARQEEEVAAMGERAAQGEEAASAGEGEERGIGRSNHSSITWFD